VKSPAQGSPQLGSLVADSVDAIIGTGSRSGPLETEVLKPLIAAAAQVVQLREGRFGPLTAEQREALNLVYGRLGQITATLRELTEGTNLAAEALREPTLIG